MSPVLTSPAERLNDALFKFTKCIAEAVDDVCSWGITIGETYVPFDPDEDEGCDDADCNQLWVRVVAVDPMAIPESWGGNGCAVTLQVSLEVGILRCIEIPSGGEAPTATDVHLASVQSMEDMLAIQCAALTCQDTTDPDNPVDIFAAITLGGWTPAGPLGGQYGGIWTFTVETF